MCLSIVACFTVLFAFPTVALVTSHPSEPKIPKFSSVEAASSGSRTGPLTQGRWPLDPLEGLPSGITPGSPGGFPLWDHPWIPWRVSPLGSPLDPLEGFPSGITPGSPGVCLPPSHLARLCDRSSRRVQRTLSSGPPTTSWGAPRVATCTRWARAAGTGTSRRPSLGTRFPINMERWRARVSRAGWERVSRAGWVGGEGHAHY